MPNRVLETTLTGRNLLSPMLAKASADVVAFNSTVAGANAKAATSAQLSAGTQDAAAAKIAASNAKASTSAATSANVQSRAHARAAESATLSARVQETANRSLAASNGLLGTSLTPITAGLGATALALGYAGYRGMEFGTAMSQVQAASQETGATLNQLRDAAMDAGAKTQYSAVEAAQGITEMSKAGVSAKDILGGGLTGALNLAAAGQISVAEAAETGATALSVFNLNGNQMSHVADLLAAGAGKAQGSVGDMSAALNQSALVANQAGLSIEDTAGALAMFASNGLLGSDAGTSFKTMLQALTPNSKQAAEAMAAIGFSAYDAQGNFVGLEGVAAQLKTGLAGLTEEQRNTTLETIFGSDAVRAAAVLYDQGADGVEKWRKNVDDAGYAARQAADLTDNLRGDLERLGGAVDATFTSIGDGAQGPLRAAVQMLTFLVDTGGDVIGFFNDLPGPVKTGVIALASMAALKGPLGDMFTGLRGGMSGLASPFSAFNEALRYARANGDGLSTVLRSVGSYAGSALKGGVSSLVGFLGGPWGIAFTAASVGVSLLVSWLGKGDDATSDMAAAQGTLRDAIAATNGVIDESVRRTAAKVLQDEGLLDFADQYGVKSQDMVGYILGEADAHDRVAGSLQRYRARLEDKLTGDRDADIVTRALIGVVDGHIDALDGLANSTTGAVAGERQLAEATGQTGTAMQGATVLTEEAAKAQEDWLNTVSAALQGFVNPLQAYEGLLDEKTQAEQEQAQATADATKSSKDSWKDYVEDVDVSLGELADRLEQQLEEQANWRTNIAKIAQWAGADVANYLLEMGKDGVDIVAKMADGTTADAQRMATDIGKVIQNGGHDWAAGMDNATKVMAAIGASGGKATRSALSKELGISVTEVQKIADQYGVKLASGINPVLSAIGKQVITINQQAGRTYLGVSKYADGGFEDHTAQIAAAGGPVRMWAEPETGGEGYVPLAPGKRDRSVPIWREIGKRLGVQFEEYAFGGISDVPRPPSTAPARMPISTAADAVMAKEYADVTAWLKANQEPAYTGGGTASASSSELVKFGRWLQSQGARVSEHPAFGGVTYGAHVANSKHYSGRAIDVNTRAGTSALEQRELDPLMAAARAAGFQVIWRAAGHFNHGHVASYKTGTPYVPQDGLAYLHRGERVVPEELNRPAAAMPGYGAAGGWGSGAGIDYDRLATAMSKVAGPRIAVDATGFNADVIADKAIARLKEHEFLTS